ncbi:MAG: hypothetical protein CL842_09515 [Crocinitomicaceae bacterium]|nr:hypothetical protein [Crocinitomicaceae bacterium]|tara:strand:- start:200078 stop:200467 length:390 start_codon:yes stop_codon:yes gene_type:complete
MKRLFILAILFISIAQLFSQKLDYYSRHVTKNGELQELTVPVIIGINLVMGSVTLNEDGVEKKTKLNSEDIVYSNDSKNSQVVIWEILQDVGPHKIVVYNYDKIADERERCFMLGKMKDCYLNIYPFQK